MSSDSTENVLVVAPHPDDAAIGCGGTIVKHAKAGQSVTIIYVTDGEQGGQDSTSKEIGTMRRTEARTAASKLGADTIKFHGQPDGSVMFNQETLQYYIERLRDERPRIVYYPSAKDADHDHTVVSDLIRSALRKAYARTFPETGAKPPDEPPKALEYEVWTPISNPTIFKSIDSILEQKERAIQCHESQLCSIDYDEAAIGLNRYRGAMSGVGRHAEAFKFHQYPESHETRI